VAQQPLDLREELEEEGKMIMVIMVLMEVDEQVPVLVGEDH